MNSWMIVDVKYINHLNFIVCNYEPLTMMIKFIEILASGASWARPWKVFHYAHGADQDLICIMGGTRACTVTFGSQMSTAILGVRMRDPNKMEIPRSVRELGVLTCDVQHCLERNILMLMCDLYWIWISFISNKHPLDISTQGTSCPPPPPPPLAAYQRSWKPNLSQLNLS